MAKATKYLIETSAVLPALEYSSRSHNVHFKEQTADGALYTSTYIRMESIRKWVCELVEFAELLDLCTSIADAHSFWAEKYGRKSKLFGIFNSEMSRRGYSFLDHETHSASLEVANIALEFLFTFDLVLGSRVQNRTGCMIGGVSLTFDGNNLLRTMSDFRKGFLNEVENCPVNQFLNLANDKSAASKLIAEPSLQKTIKLRKLVTPMQGVKKDESIISCRKCATTGDAIIALEQPSSWTVVHVDASFTSLCPLLIKPHKEIRSNSSFSPKPSDTVRPSEVDDNVAP